MTRFSKAVVVVLGFSLLAAPSVANADQHDEVDGRAHVSWVEGVVDEDGQLWFKVGFYLPWDENPPDDVFSLFWSLTVTVGDEARTIGWQTHDGENTFLGAEGTQAFILDNGCILIATGIYPEEPYEVEIQASFASWEDEATTDAVSGSERMGTSSEFVQMGEPFEVVGAPVYDLTNGSPVTGDGPDTPVEPGSTTTSAQSTSSTSGSTESSDDGATDTGSNLLPLFFVVIALLFLLWWFGIRPRRYAYRADREVGLDIIEDGDASTGPLVLEAERVDSGAAAIGAVTDSTFEDPCWEQRQKLNEAQARLLELEAEQRETDPEHEETHRALDQAIEQAQENVAAAERALDECLASGEPTAGGGGGNAAMPPPTSPAAAPPEKFSNDCREEEEAYEAAVAATDQAKDQRDEAEAAWLDTHTALSALENRTGEPAQEADLEAARTAETEARAARDAAVGAQDAAIDAESAARRALDACRRVRVDEPDTADDGPVGVATETSEPSEDCTEGAEEWRYESQSRPFVVLDGDLRLRISNAPATWGAWQLENGTATTVSAAALRSLDRGQMESLLSPLPDHRRVIPSMSIPTKRIRVRCERLYRCVGGTWVATDQVRKNPMEYEGPDEGFGGRDVSTVGNILELLARVKDRLDELASELEAGRAYECDQ